MASGGLLSLKWNNHKTTFFHVLSTIRSEEAYCDATIACGGRFYPVHKLVMSTCSDYFKEMFERTNCKQPVIVLKDIRHEDLEALLNYMYVGEVNVLQNELAALIKAAECLQIKGLAVPDEAPTKDSPNESKRGVLGEDSPQAKRRRNDSDSARYDSGSSNKGRLSTQNQSPTKSQFSLSHQKQSDRYSSSSSSQSSSFRRPTITPHHTSNNLPDNSGSSLNSTSHVENIQTSPEHFRSQDKSSSQTQKSVSELLAVKDEPEEIQEIEDVQEDTKNVLKSSFSYDLVNEGNSMSDIGDGGSHDTQGFDTHMMSGTPQSMEELVSQAMPGSPGMQGNTLWDSEGSLQGFPSEAFSDSQRPSQMVPMGEDRRGGGDISTGITTPAQYQNKSYTCPYCPYQTYKTSNIRTHIRTHTGEKPFLCPFCSYGATQSGNLQRHIKTIHSNDIIN